MKSGLRSLSLPAYSLVIILCLVLVLTVGASAQLANGPWPMFRHDLRHTGLSPNTDPVGYTPYWKYYVGGGLSSPAIGPDGTIYIGGSSSLFALNSNGTLKWSFSIGGSTRSSPAVGSDGTIYIGSSNDRLYAVNPNGTQKWSYLTGNDITSSPAIAPDGTIYVGSRDGRLYAFNPNGTKKWHYTTGDIHMSSPAVGSDGTVYVGGGGKVWAINPNGTLKWSYSPGDGVLSSPAISADGTKIYVGCYDGYLYALNAADGSLYWRYLVAFKNGSTTGSPAIGSDGTIYIGSNYGTLYALSPEGEELWVFETNNDIRSSPAVSSSGTIYFSTYEGYVYAVNADGSKKWHFLMKGSGYSSPAIAADGTVVIASFDGYCYGNLRGTPPTAIPPSNLVATPISETSVRLDWTDNSSDEYGFRIERKIGASGTYALVATTGANVQTYTDTGLQSGQNYVYRVCAFQEGGNSGYSNEAPVTTPGLEAPMDLVATPISATRVDLSWTDRSSTELGFKIERAKGPSDIFQQIAVVGTDITSFSDLSVAPATNYYYRVRAYDATRNSSYSNEDWALTDGMDFSEVLLGNTQRPWIALTFDAGTAAIRSGLLTILRENKVYCTFFPTGVVTLSQPGQIQQIAADGHHLGNHTYDHPDLRDLSAEQIAWQLSLTDDIIYAACGHHTRSYFRAPYGLRNEAVLQAAADAGFRHIYWSQDTGDANGATTQQIIDRALGAARNGAIILMHCTLSTTEAALPTIISELRNRGYELVTIPELLAPEVVTSPQGIINPGWNLISIPTEIANPTPQVVFRGIDIDANLVRWDKENHSWKFYDAINPGSFGQIDPDEGFYLYVSSPTTIKCAGAQPTAPRHIKLPQTGGSTPQWALIGYPFSTPQEWSNCTIYNPYGEEPKTRSFGEAVDAGWINPTLWWWDSATQSFCSAGRAEDFPLSTQAEPWRGYWIQVNTSGMELIIPVP